MHVFYEGELAFAGILERRLGGATGMFDAPLPGVQFLARGTGDLISGPALNRITALDDIPSPYASGLLDKFFDGVLTPLVETARGCPFRCNFCNAGDVYFTKVNQFSDAYVEDELTYIARKASQLGIGHVTFADNNFGMIPRDSRTAALLYRLQHQYQWPRSVTVWTGKNSKERVIEVTRQLGETLSISMSVQSMDPAVLKTIKRDNIKLDHYRKIAEDLNAQGRPLHSEVIMPLPGETLKSHIDGLNALLDSNVREVLSHTLQMLHGTPYKDDESYRREYGYVTKWRLVPLDFSRIDGQPIFDVEEVGVATNTLTFEEYVAARKYLFVIDLSYNNNILAPLKRYLRERGIPASTWITKLYQGLDGLAPPLLEIFESFEHETQRELWDSEQELIAFYSEPENYQKLLNYEAGGNVLFKHRVWALSRASTAWVKGVFRLIEPLVMAAAETRGARERVTRELATIERYILSTVVGGFSEASVTTTVSQDFDFDVPQYLSSPMGAALADFANAVPQTLIFSFDGRMLAVLRDGFQRYGSHLAGLVKMVQRVHGISFVRSARYEGQNPVAENPVPQSQQYGPGYSSL